MPVRNTDRNLLFGFLALQNDFISREDLIAAVSVWLTDKSRALGEILLQRQALQQDEHELLAALTRKHLERHGDDAQTSLTALSSLGSLRDELQSLGAADVEVEASLSLVGRDREALGDRCLPCRRINVRRNTLRHPPTACQGCRSGSGWPRRVMTGRSSCGTRRPGANQPDRASGRFATS